MIYILVTGWSLKDKQHVKSALKSLVFWLPGYRQSNRKHIHLLGDRGFNFRLYLNIYLCQWFYNILYNKLIICVHNLAFLIISKFLLTELIICTPQFSRPCGRRGENRTSAPGWVACKSISGSHGRGSLHFRRVVAKWTPWDYYSSDIITGIVNIRIASYHVTLDDATRLCL